MTRTRIKNEVGILAPVHALGKGHIHALGKRPVCGGNVSAHVIRNLFLEDTILCGIQCLTYGGNQGFEK